MRESSHEFKKKKKKGLEQAICGSGCLFECLSAHYKYNSWYYINIIYRALKSYTLMNHANIEFV